MNNNRTRWLGPVLACVSAVAALGCNRRAVTESHTFYDRKIGPTLLTSCASSPTRSGCHVRADNHGNALGNLDVESYATVSLRRDLLTTYGPYGVPGLLLKVVPPYELRLTSWDEQEQIVTTDIAHQGGSLIDFASTSFNEISKWIDHGATENNAPVPKPSLAFAPCTTEIGSDPAFDPTTDPPDADYGQFVSSVVPVLKKNCAAGNCHGTTANTMYLTCGDSPEQQRWNYFVMGDYVSTNPANSEILRRALAPEQGGTFHEGGTVFGSPTNLEYLALSNWAQAKGGPSHVPTDAGFDFFAKRVQPILAKRGCMQIGCHSAAMGHEYRLRGGSGGHFGLPATRRNYALTREQIALDSPDPNASRIIRKNLPPTPSGGGILHRGGSLFASGGDPTACDLAAAETGPLDDQPEYCVIVAWIEKERQARMAGAMALSGIAYVKRPPAPGLDAPQDYATYAPGADLLLAPATLDATGTVVMGGAGQSLLGTCGLSPSTADVRKPAVSWDGTKIAFAARDSKDKPLAIYIYDGTSCAPDPTINAAAVDDQGNAVPTNGELVHNFDPAFAPDGRLVFASTRGNIMNTKAFDYQGPQRTPADPSKLNANLYVLDNGKIRQLTFLLDQELAPSFMNDGRLIFTTEKRAPGFYQLAGRRMNLDGGDYHPLFGQRSTIGFNQLMDVVELSDKDFAAIVSEKGAAHEAGALAIINRSLGIDQESTDPADYVQDASAVDFPNPAFYQHSMRIVDGAATGKLAGTQGAYRDPSPLPDGKVLVSYAANVADLSQFNGNFDVFEVDPETGAKTPLITDADDLVWPVAVYARYNPHGVYKSKLDEPNGATRIYPERADRSQVTFLDVPLLASLLFQNTRSGREMPAASGLGVWEDLPPEPGVTSFDAGGNYVTSDAYGQLYVRRRSLGSAHLEKDGSSVVQIPGGVPIVLSMKIKLAGDGEAVQHFQREEMQFYPGEWVRQGFRHELFNGVCGSCHGSVAGLEDNVAANPDILTQASRVDARDATPTDLVSTSGPVQAPPFP